MSGKTEVTAGDIARPVQIVNGNKTKTTARVAEPLQHVVGRKLGLARLLEAQMLTEHVPGRAGGELIPRGQQVAAEMTRGKPLRHVDQPREDDHPGGEEVQVAAGTADRNLQYEREGQVDQGRRSHRTRLAPVEPGVGEQDRNAAEDEHKETQRADPVRDPDQCRVPRFPRNGVGLHCVLIRPRAVADSRTGTMDGQRYWPAAGFR